MNIIKIENVKEVDVRSDGITALNNFKMDSNSNKSVIIVMNDNDINNINTANKLRGFYISCIVIPKGKYLLAELENQLRNNFKKGKIVISYY